MKVPSEKRPYECNPENDHAHNFIFQKMFISAHMHKNKNIRVIRCEQRKTEIGNFNGATIPFLTLVTWARTKALADEQAMGPLTPLNVKTFSII